MILTRKFENNIYFDKTKILDLYKKLVKEINIFLNFKRNIKYIVIDGPMTKNKLLLNLIKKKYPDFKIYTFFNEYASALAIAKIINKKNRKKDISKFYKLI